MKVTIELADPLVLSAKALAKRRQTTLRSLVEDGLHRVLADAQGTTKPAFKLKDARVHGKQLLVTDPWQWQQMEEQHVASRARAPMA